MAREREVAMNKEHLTLVNPQWQGGGQGLTTYEGAHDLENRYLSKDSFIEVPVSTAEVSPVINEIQAYDDILRQTKAALEILETNKPKKVFAVGGGCDADLATMSYLNGLYDGDIGIVYFDSHGDINTPQESVSKRFYGMPVRTLLGEGDAGFIEALPSTLDPKQLVFVGLRDLDKAEAEYLSRANISVVSVDAAEADSISIVNTVKLKGYSKIYIHIDLDVLDPHVFPHVPLPAPDGLSLEAFSAALNALQANFEIVGIGLYEYKETEEIQEILKQIVSMGESL